MRQLPNEGGRRNAAAKQVSISGHVLGRRAAVGPGMKGWKGLEGLFSTEGKLIAQYLNLKIFESHRPDLTLLTPPNPSGAAGHCWTSRGDRWRSKGLRWSTGTPRPSRVRSNGFLNITAAE